ncbi:MAG: hypothetical protein AAF065_08420 [Verrucomicrobiota bacterium]
MISLAPIRYANITAEGGGPLKTLEYGRYRLAEREVYQASAYLIDELVTKKVRTHTKTPVPDGAGTHESVQIACHMAVSEAIERWVVYDCRERMEENPGGIQIDGGSNGFAAFPGLFARQARRAAFSESIERHCLMSWWEGLLGHRKMSGLPDRLEGIQIENPFSKHDVVLIWRDSEQGRVYAFGAAKDLEGAIWRSRIEFERTEALLRAIRKDLDSDGELGVFESRILYFSSDEGCACFDQRLEKHSKAAICELNLLFDCAVRGPWDKFAYVWRTIIKPPSRDYLSNAADYFFW